MTLQQGIPGLGNPEDKIKKAKPTYTGGDVTPTHVIKESANYVQGNILGGVSFEKAKAPEIGVLEINNRTSLSTYCPIPEYRILKSLRDYPIEDREAAMNNLYYSFVHNYKVRKDWAVFLPCYVVEKPTDPDDLKEWDARKVHLRTFSEVCVLLQDREGMYPRMVVPTDDSRNPKYVYKDMKAGKVKDLAAKYQKWIYKNIDDLKCLFFSDLQLARKVFPEITWPGSFSKSVYQIFKIKVKGKTLKIMVLPTPQQLTVNEEKGYEFCADIFEIMKHSKPKPRIKVGVLNSIDKLKKILDDWTRKGVKRMAIDIETTGLNPLFHDQRIISVAFSDGCETWAFLVDHPDRPKEVHIDMIKYLLTFEGIPNHIYQNAKYELKWFKAILGIDIKARIWDTMLIDHLLNESFGSFGKKMSIPIYGMDSQIPRYLYITSHKDMLKPLLEKIDKVPVPELIKKKAADMSKAHVRELVKLVTSPMLEPGSRQYAKLPIDVLLEYNGQDTWMTCNIFDEMMKRVVDRYGRSNLPEVLMKIQPQQLPAIAAMELNGAPINYDYTLDEIQKSINLIWAKKEILEESIDIGAWESINNCDFNIDSPSQLLKYLLKHEKIDHSLLYDPDEKKYKLDEDHLKEVAGDLPWMNDYIVYKKAQKAKNTYLIPFIQKSYLGKIYFSLNITGTATGRLSSNNPNLQNIAPSLLKKTEDEIFLKPCIQAPEGYEFFDMDYATLEVKALTITEYCPDEALVNAINNGDDIHCKTAAGVFNVPYPEVLQAKRDADDGKQLTKQQKTYLEYRQAAKAAIFGAVYGIGPVGFSKKSMPRNPKDTDEEHLAKSKAVLDNLQKKAYPKLGEFFEKNDIALMTKGYAETVFGRRRNLKLTLAHQVYKIVEEANMLSVFGLKGVHNLVTNKRAFRQFGNFLIQSTGSDIVQTFVAEMFKSKDPEFDICMVAQVHDSVIGYYKKSDKAREYFEQLIERCAEAHVEETLGDKLPVRIGHAIDYGRGYHLH